MLKVLRYVFSVVTLVLALYGVITKDFRFGHVMILSLSIVMLVMGIDVLKKDQKGLGLFLIAIFLFSLYVSIEGFLLS